MQPSEDPNHWTYDPAKHRANLIARVTRGDLWLVALAVLSILWPAFWLLAVMSRAVALGGGV